MNLLSDQLKVELFGPPRIRYGARSVAHFQTQQTALLLAYLITFPRNHPRDEIVDLLWPEADPAQGRPRLSLTLWRLRQILDELSPGLSREVLSAERNTIGIVPSSVKSDLAEFRQLARRTGKRKGAALKQAAAIYGDTGGFLP